MNTKNWLLLVQGEMVGYWPGTILSVLGTNAHELQWGGEIYNSKANGHHTTTQMGSGHFPNEGYEKSCFFHNIQVIDNTNYAWSDPADLQKLVTNSLCYDLEIKANKQTTAGTYFYYGGPGYSAQCP